MKTKIFSNIILAGIVLFSSCTNLDEKLYDKVDQNDYGKTEAEIQTIVGAAYASLRGFNDSNEGGTICYPTGEFVFFLNACASDEATIPTRGTDWYDGGRYQDIQRHQWKIDNILVWSAWKYCYQGIAKINTIIYQVDQSQLTENDKDKVKAELRGLRAYYYYLLLDQFGNVPLVVNFEEEEMPKNTARKDVFTFVEKELLESLDLLPENRSYGRLTQPVANSILARLYLNAEVYTGTPRWQDCIDACERVSLAGYTLEQDYFANFKADNNKSQEIIFAIPYDHKAGTVGNYLASMTYHCNQKEAFSINASYPWCGNGISAQPGLYSSFEENDTRANALLIGEQISMSKGTVVLMDNGNPLIYTEEIKNFTNALQNEGARLHKYEVKADDQWERDYDLVLIRYSEILMMKAEASFRLNYIANAHGIVNDVRARAGLKALDKLTLEALDNEWRHEFVFEGLRRTTNIRFGTYFKPWWEKGVSEEYKALFPIPKNVLGLNPKLEQNPGYPK